MQGTASISYMCTCHSTQPLSRRSTLQQPLIAWWSRHNAADSPGGEALCGVGVGGGAGPVGVV